MRVRHSLTRRQGIAQLAFAAVVVVACAGLIGAAALVPAPVTVLPLVVIVCVGMPMVATVELPAAIAALRRDAAAIAALRRHLAQLPETAHPLEDAG
jgi:hypothetical protein